MLKARLCQATAVLLFLLSLVIAAPVIARAGEPDVIGAHISTLAGVPDLSDGAGNRTVEPTILKITNLPRRIFGAAL